MPDRRFRGLKKQELLEILIAQDQELENLKKEHKDMAGKTNRRSAREELAAELDREERKKEYRRVIRSTLGVLIVAAAVSVLAAVLFFPVLRIYGSSMAPGIDKGDILVTLRGSSYEPGDIISFYYNNEILVKRVIATSGDWVDIDGDGTVYVNGELLEEPYLTEKSFGECDISLPYQVPDGKVFVMGDHRATSVDSRNRAVGCIEKEDIVGKVIFRLWPLNEIGKPD